MSKLLYKSVSNSFKLYFKFYYRYEVIGKRNIPEEGRLVVVANHTTYLDPPIIGSILNRQIHFMAKEELFRNPILGFLLKKVGQFPVKRGRPDKSALKNSFEILRSEEVLGIFPEGSTRGKDKGLRKAKSGAILIPIREKSPIIPIGIKFIGKRLRVSIGKPFVLDKYYNHKLTKEERKEAGSYIMDKIAHELSKI